VKVVEKEKKEKKAVPKKKNAPTAVPPPLPAAVKGKKSKPYAFHTGAMTPEMKKKRLKLKNERRKSMLATPERRALAVNMSYTQRARFAHAYVKVLGVSLHCQLVQRMTFAKYFGNHLNASQQDRLYASGIAKGHRVTLTAAQVQHVGKEWPEFTKAPQKHAQIDDEEDEVEGKFLFSFACLYISHPSRFPEPLPPKKQNKKKKKKARLTPVLRPKTAVKRRRKKRPRPLPRAPHAAYDDDSDSENYYYDEGDEFRAYQLAKEMHRNRLNNQHFGRRQKNDSWPAQFQ
jgi:hypothetical protein